MNGNPFLLTLKTTFKDEVYLYMLLELCQGGELFTRLLEEVRSETPAWDSSSLRLPSDCCA